MNILTCSILIGISSFLICLILLTSNETQKDETQIRLDKIKRKSFESEKEIKERISLLVKDTAYRIQFIGFILKRFSFSSQIKNSLYLADSNLQVDTFLFLSFLCGFIGFCLISIKSIIFAPTGFVLSIIPSILLHSAIQKRLKMFTQQFPDALNMISSSLRAGHPLMASFETVVQEMPKPVCSVFKHTVDEISLGIDIKEALNSMVKLIPQSMDLKFFVTAVLIQRDVGGNLAELLDSLSGTIRERFKILGQLKAQTAQTRFSGIILSVMPPLVGGAIFALSPEYMEPLLTTENGKLALLGSIFLTLLGLYCIKKITDIEV
mgnify:CR=1 FL=1